MKNISFLFAVVLFSINLNAQAPQKFSYQTVIRNSSNQLLINQLVSIKISILQGTESGSIVYSESHTPTTNANGLATLSIGAGALLNGSFSNIAWANGPYFIKIETDPNGGNNYTITNTQQLLTVPFALYSGNGISKISSTGDTLYLGNGSSIIIPGISGANEIGQTGLTQHSCGSENIHNPSKIYGSMADQEGNVYKTIVIGTQLWMAENLKTSHYRNGASIPNVTDQVQWHNLSTSSWVHFNNSSQFECPYGNLYNWYAVSDPRNLCPIGWHVPTFDEWTALTNYLGGAAVAGGKMKVSGTSYWQSPNPANNESGFSGLPGALRNYYFNSDFNDFGFSCYMWSSTEQSTTDAWRLNIYYNNSWTDLNANDKHMGFAVRCIKD